MKGITLKKYEPIYKGMIAKYLLVLWSKVRLPTCSLVLCTKSTCILNHNAIRDGRDEKDGMMNLPLHI